MSAPPPTRAGPSAALLGAALALLLLLALALCLRHAGRSAPLARAWAAVRTAGAYRFEGWSRARAGGQSWRQDLRGWGAGDGTLVLDLLDPQPAVAAPLLRYRLAWPEAWELAEGRPPQPVAAHGLAPLLPTGDPLALLAVGQGQRAGPLEPVAGRDCRRVDFRVAARAYQAWWSEHRGHWPVNAGSGGLDRFDGRGSVWLDPATDLPCRIALRVELPRLAGEQAGWGEVDLRYEGW